jgi:hypothetical protein
MPLLLKKKGYSDRVNILFFIEERTPKENGKAPLARACLQT